MATASDVRALTATYRAQQVRQAALVAALAAAYYRSKVDPTDPRAVERWLDQMVPRIMGQHDKVARLAARYATDLRRLEIPNEPELVFEPQAGAVIEQVRRSLQVVGPNDYMNKMRKIERLEGLSPTQERALIREAKEVTARKIAASTLRHVQHGGRSTLIEAAEEDPVAQGYVRVTREKPCFFCAMLASRGLVFEGDSFDLSDPRFTGEGTAKVHDNCQCCMKPVYDQDNDPLMADVKKFEDMWTDWGAGGGSALLRFRRGYERWLKDGTILTWDEANEGL